MTIRLKFSIFLELLIHFYFIIEEESISIFSIFQGYQYDEVEDGDLNVIQLFLDHIKNII